MKILIVDDNEPTRKLLTQILNDYGVTMTAENGAQAVDMFERALEMESSYELLFMDILMPVKDGQTALREIRSLEQHMGIPREERCVAIMVSAMDDAANMSEAFFQGEASGYLLKPVTRQTVVEKLEELDIQPK